MEEKDIKIEKPDPFKFAHAYLGIIASKKLEEENLSKKDREYWEAAKYTADKELGLIK